MQLNPNGAGRSRPRRNALAALVVLLGLVLAACSGGTSTAPASGDTAAPTKITVGVIPIVDTAAFRLGVSKGFFAEKGLDVTLQDAQGGAAIVPAVVSGANQFGFSNMASLIIAQERQLPVRLIAAGVATTGDASADYGGVVVKADSGITSAKDLAGKTVAVNGLKGLAEITVLEAVEKDGGDPKAVKFVEMPFPDMPGQLSSGNIDAAWSFEPFVAVMKGQGAKALPSDLAGFDEKLQIAGFFTSAQYAAANPEVVTAFTEALARSNEYASQNPDELRTFLTTYTTMDPALAKAVTLPTWPTSINEPALQKLADSGRKYGVTTGAVDTQGLLLK